MLKHGPLIVKICLCTHAQLRQTLESDVAGSGWLPWFHGAIASFPAPSHKVPCSGSDRVVMVAFTLVLTFSVQMMKSVCTYGYAHAGLHALITDKLLTAQVTAGSVMPDWPEITCNSTHSPCTNSLWLVWQTMFSYAVFLPWATEEQPKSQTYPVCCKSPMVANAQSSGLIYSFLPAKSQVFLKRSLPWN